MTYQKKIKGILVTFYRKGSKHSYLDALNNAIKEIEDLNRPNMFDEIIDSLKLTKINYRVEFNKENDSFCFIFIGETRFEVNMKNNNLFVAENDNRLQIQYDEIPEFI